MLTAVGIALCVVSLVVALRAVKALSEVARRAIEHHTAASNLEAQVYLDNRDKESEPDRPKFGPVRIT